MPDRPISRVVERLRTAIKSGRRRVVRDRLKDVRHEDLAEALPRLEPEEAVRLLESLDDETAADLLTDAPTETVRQVIEGLSDEKLASYLDILPMDDAVELHEEVDPERFERLLDLIPTEDADEIRRLYSYPEDSVGRIMTERFFEVKQGDTVEQILADVRAAPDDKYETVNDVYVLDDDRRLLGVFSLRKALRVDADIAATELMQRDVVTVSATDDDEDAARMMARYGFYALPVLDVQGRMVGLFTGDDAQDILREHETEDVLAVGAVSGNVEAYMSLSVWQLVKRRVPWLGALFIAETFTGMVMRHYGQQGNDLGLAPVAFFIPLLIGAGGNAGAQVTTTITRSLAIGEVETSDWFAVLKREVLTAVLIGLVLGLAGFLRALFGWGTPFELSLVVGISLPLIVLWAGFVGSLLPIGARRMGIDPAVMSAPFITTLVDATGLVIYFEMAHRIIGPGAL